MELATIILAIATIWLAVETRLGLTHTMQVNTWIEMEKRFDGQEMKLARRHLAVQMEHYNPTGTDDIDETVMDMFDDMGGLYRRNLIDRDMTESFSYQATRWWKACEPYIASIRKQEGGKDSFKDFEDFAKEMERKYDPQQISSQDMGRFYEDKKHLAVYPAAPR
jgi:hypothetical protein